MIAKLVKINITAMFAGALRVGKRKKKIKPITAILIGLLVIYVVAALFISVGAVFYSFSTVFFEIGIAWLYFALAGIFVFALCFISGIFMVQAQIFSARDNELLLSMPIKPSAILAGRLATLLIVEYLFEALVLIPVFAVLIINGLLTALPAAGVVFYFLSALLLPLIALALGCLVGWIVALISSRIRRKNIVTLILSVGFLVAYFMGYSAIIGQITALQQRGAEIAEAVRRAVFPAYHLGVAIAGGNVLSFLIFAVCSIVPFALMYIILSVSFMKITTGTHGAKKIEYHEKTLRSSGARLALLKKELLLFWSQPMYILNSSLGSIASVVIAGILAVKPDLILGIFDPLTGMYAGLFDTGIAGAIVLAALAAMNFISAPSISLEGKHLWISKSLPVPSRDILDSKIGLHIVVSGVPAVLAGIACIFVVPMSGIQAILTFLLPAAVTLVFATLGITLNLIFPRFDWINPVQPVKQGLSTMLSMFGGMALIAALVMVYIFVIDGMLVLETFLLLCVAVFVAVAAGLYAYVAGAGSRRFDSF